MKKVTNKVLWLFAIGQLGWAILGGIVSNWFVFFYQPTEQTQALGLHLFVTQHPIFLGLTILGVIAAIGRIFDAITDPIIANKSDQSSHKDGRRIPFMRFIALPFGVVTVLLFIMPVDGVSMVNNVVLLVMNLLFYLCMTIYCTPYNALIPELGKEQDNRINLSTFISMTFIVGTAFAYLIPNIAGLFEASLGYTNAFRAAVAVLAAVAVICMYVPVFTIKEKDYCEAIPSHSSVTESLGKTFSNKEFRKFVASDVLYFLSLTIFQTGLPFYVTALMGLEAGSTFILFAIMTGLSLVFYAPINKFAKSFGKKKLVLFAFIWFSCVFVLTGFCQEGLMWGIVIAALASIPMAILGILPQAIVADIAERSAIETGENRNGMFFAARTFAFKFGQAAAILIFTSLAALGTGDTGYRLSAFVAAGLCFVGAAILSRYKEKETLEVIRSNRQ
jgi:GPH family glycoside/pentoside/hexuronide:cation symporter